MENIEPASAEQTEESLKLTRDVRDLIRTYDRKTAAKMLKCAVSVVDRACMGGALRRGSRIALRLQLDEINAAAAETEAQRLAALTARGL